MNAPAPRQTDGEGPHHDANTTEARAKSPYSLGEKVRRALWMLVGQPLFSFTFHDWYGLRNWWLRRFGATIAPTARLRPSVKIEQPWRLTVGADTMVGDHAILYCLGPVTIGDHCSISQFAHLCAGTHDYTRPDMRLVKLPIVVGNEVWIAADAFVGPGVTIGDGAVVGARTSVYKDLEPWKVYAGNPARAIKDRVLSNPDAPFPGVSHP
ncbi:MAG: colanic acid biosynthesis acetyltransferase WcaF [Phycisphaerales bacterium]|nr:MAG: colanic acid biosynthesis acetyltransferase WcaF [Phycisphaerales bacterium]